MPFSFLIVDDSLPMRAVIKKNIRAAGYATAEFLEAENGIKALEILKTSWVDIVLTDFNMPEMNGLEMITQIKNNKMFEQIPVVIISTEGSEEKINEFMEIGASGYIKKPFAPEQLRDLLIQLIGETDYEESIDEPDDDFDF